MDRALIVLHSDRSELELRELVNDSGADGYIRKTGDTRLLVSSLRGLLAKRPRGA